ncbi:FAD/NAD(P)-binding protein [Streptomyces luteolus]|uniref:FAD/NAD(P)-binding protein n=1 Tax=Streptomyces luteolus TaxID=3043615 RepID=A0ABT6T7W0_9ACTN|nr:FAD/NAD(P)-binding protein [Streptomyces sp. B-S-A12]MDI3423949.1 FAD/NAD(P)-binding protein [Streptomyces sp. B-S-A12]
MKPTFRTSPVRHRTPATAVSIIGLGSRGIGVLERLITHTSHPDWQRRPLTVDLVDPGCDGTGLHTPDQPDHLLLNTVCSQVSLFPEEATVGDAVGDRGPNLYEWVRELQLRLADDGFTLQTEGREIRPDDYLPRRILGSYLSWFLQRTLRRAPDHLNIRLHPATALTLDADPGEQDLRVITLDNGTVLRSHHVFLTTGHTPEPPAPRAPGEDRRIRSPYPPAEQFADVAPEHTIALAGTGLSGMDALAALTVGRGGRHADGAYEPSGREPRIVLFSRTGLPFRARPHNNRDGAFEPLALTRARIDRLRTGSTDGTLSLHGDLVPLICAEMRIAFHRRCAHLAGAAAATEQTLRDAARDGTLDAALDVLDGRHAQTYGQFVPERVLFPGPGPLDTSAAHQDHYTAALRADLDEANAGLGASPLKSALEVLRDQRDIIRYAVDFAGLDEKSHDEFYGAFTAVLNRSVTGPQLDRHRELLALIDAGVVEIPLGPEPEVVRDETAGVWRLASTRLTTGHTVHADWLCHATSGQPDIDRTGSALLNHLRDTGRLRRHRPDAPHSRGVDLTRAQHPVGRDTTVDTRLWILGPLTEGATFYNHYVPSPGGPNRALLDADRSVRALLATARTQEPRIRGAAPAAPAKATR